MQMPHPMTVVYVVSSKALDSMSRMQSPLLLMAARLESSGALGPTMLRLKSQLPLTAVRLESMLRLQPVLSLTVVRLENSRALGPRLESLESLGPPSLALHMVEESAAK